MPVLPKAAVTDLVRTADVGEVVNSCIKRSLALHGTSLAYPIRTVINNESMRSDLTNAGQINDSNFAETAANATTRQPRLAQSRDLRLSSRYPALR